MKALRIALSGAMLAAALAWLGAPMPVAAETSDIIEVSQPTYLTGNSEYDRNPSIVYDGTEYWLFYTKGDDTSTSGVRGDSYNPDSDTYVVYYKTAPSIDGLASVSETKLALSESDRPANFDQRVASATYFDTKVYVFVSSGQSGTDRGLYYYEYDGSDWSGPTTLIADATARGGHVNVTSDADRVYIVWESSDGSSDCYTWDGTTLSSKVDISNDNMPKVTLMDSTLYVVGIEDGSGDIEVQSATAAAATSFSAHSTAIAGAGLYDPVIFNDGTDLYVVSAPWVPADRQYLVQTRYSEGVWATARTVSYGGYGGIEWWDYWPIGYHDGTDLYLFFTTETNSPTFSDGEIAYVKMDWDLDNDHYFYIQNAVDQAASGAVINVAAGTYAETVTIDKSLTLVAASDVRPIMDGDTDGDGIPDGNVITIAADQVSIAGFEIRNGYNGIAGETSSSAITNNVVHDNLNIPGSAGVGILLWGENDQNAIQGNVVFNNDRQGILIGYSDDSKISNNNSVANNTIYDNGLYREANGPSEAEYGIHLWNADGSIIEFNEIFGHHDWSPGPGKGIYLTASDGNAIFDNNIHDNGYGVAVHLGSADTYLAGNIIHDNAINGLTILDPGSSSTLVNFNQFCRNGEYGVRNMGYSSSTGDVDATFNWWGSASGPGPVGPGTGDHASEGVSFWPWDDVPPTDGPCHINSIHVQKYEDFDGSGDKGDTEPGLNGWLITLYDAEGHEVMSDTTHTVGYEAGWVLFEDLPPGDYTVCETTQDGWINTDPGDVLPCKPITVSDDGRGPGTGPLFTFIDHPGDDEFRFTVLGINLWALDLSDLDEPTQINLLSEPWLCVLAHLVDLDIEDLLEEPWVIDPYELIQWDLGQGFEDGLYYLVIEEHFDCPIRLGIKTWAGSGGYSTATGFVECGSAPTVLLGNYREPPTAIDLVSFTAEPDAPGVTLTWETGTEIDNAGFNLYRAASESGPYAKVNAALIAAQGDAVSGASYSFTDNPGAGTFYYKLEDVDYYGASTHHGPVQVTLAPPFRRPLRRPTLPPDS